jgi:hypothetical protein
VVRVHRDRAWAWAWACVAIFSSHTMEWQVVLPEMDTAGGCWLTMTDTPLAQLSMASSVGYTRGWGGGGMHPRAQHCDISVLSDGFTVALESVILNVSAWPHQGWEVLCRQCTAMHAFCLALGSQR